MNAAHVPLMRHRWPEFCRDTVKPLVSALPFYEREGDGYVHVVRQGHMHYHRDTGRFSHVSYGFWCGQSGFLVKKRGRLPAKLTAELSAGRRVCASCLGRSIGAGQLSEPYINGKPVKYKPHTKWMREGQTVTVIGEGL